MALKARFQKNPLKGILKAPKRLQSWALFWTPEIAETIQESYVNLVPTPQGGTHVNGFRTGLLEAMREFCEFRNLLPRGVKLAPEDVWENFVLYCQLKC